jgi:predicted lactoylglutathione lyase
MTTKILVNLPINNLNKSIEFFTQRGIMFNPHKPTKPLLA